MEVYIDDMLVKSQQAGDHIQYLSDTFQILRKFNMKLNPEKCAFDVSSELPSRLTKWAIELSECDITYQPRTAIKSQVLADFVADFSLGIQAEAEKELHVFNRSNPGLELARELGIVQVIIKSDSQLVVNQMQGTYISREARIQQYLKKARDLVRQFQTWKVTQIPREENVEADALANLASATEVTNEEM
ncbi:uncharacterized protein [Nicotiana sylvestris]|uniref:uncharacterized protein n=1 Tax=Nicotiana sylvestris TaxID=4096 RepID=UPI00388C6832